MRYMKKIFLFLTACLLLVFSLCSCRSLKMYQAEDGGSVVYLKQSNEVSAVADHGYRFVEWSDGVRDRNRTYNGKLEEALTAEFEPIRVILCQENGEEIAIPLPELAEHDLDELLPTSEVGAYLSSYASAELCERFGFDENEDVLTQLRDYVLEEEISEMEDLVLEDRFIYYLPTEGGVVTKTESGFEAISLKGYRFLGWADGTKSSTRTDGFLSESRTIEARFEPIMMEWYDGSTLIRSIPMKEFATMEGDDLFGFVRGKIFQKWYFRSSPIPFTPNFEEDIVPQIQRLYAEHDVRDLENFSLSGTYIDSRRTELYQYKTIAHAMGGAPWLEHDKTYLNSMEVFNYHYALGQRFFEIDLLLTYDGKVVALHDYESTKTYDEFMSTAREGFTPIDLTMMIDMMIEYPEMLMDLDILSVYRSGYEGTTAEKLTLFYDLLDEELRRQAAGDEALYEDVYDRLILEIFWEAPFSSMMLDIASNGNYGYKHFMFAGVGDKEMPMGTELEELDALCRWCVDNDIWMISTKILDRDFIAMTDRYDIFTFAYTFNSEEYIKELLANGIDCVFSDFVYLE